MSLEKGRGLDGLLGPEQASGGNGNLLGGSGAGSGMVAGGGGSVDLSSFRRTTGDEYGYEPEPPELNLNTPTPVARQDSNHRPRESFDDAGWEGMDGSVGGAMVGEEGQAGPGPSTIRAISRSGSASSG